MIILRFSTISFLKKGGGVSLPQESIKVVGDIENWLPHLPTGVKKWRFFT